jgi:hypothetical protein
MPDRRKVSRAAIAHSGEPHASSLLRVSLSSALDPSRLLLTYLFCSVGVAAAERRGVASEAAEDSAPYESCCTQPTIDAEARQAEAGLLSKRERRNEVRSVRDRASSPDAEQCRSGDTSDEAGDFRPKRISLATYARLKWRRKHFTLTAELWYNALREK